MTLIGRAEDEAALRDAWLLRQSGDEAGPAGNVLGAWRRLAGRSLPPGVEDLQAVAVLLGIDWSDGFGELIDIAGEEVRGGAPAPVVAAAACAACSTGWSRLGAGARTVRPSDLPHLRAVTSHGGGARPSAHGRGGTRKRGQGGDGRTK
jgi:hypothetical protein